MKTSIFLCLFSVLGMTPDNVLSQNVKIVIDTDKTVTVDQVFMIISDQTDYEFIYHQDLFKDLPKVALKKGIINANTLLKQSISNDNIAFEFGRNNTIIIKEKPATAFVVTTVQQGFKVSGTVNDSTGQPLPGASIIEKGTTNGVTTDFDGNYTIEVSDENITLIVSYIGFSSEEIAIAGQTQIDVVLKESASSLEEVVVIGYGATVKKRDLTGAVSSANLDNATDFPNVSIAQALQGSLAGLNIGAVTNAGQNPIISIRGQNTLSSSSGDNAPLIVLDGIIYRGSLVDLNPADIASVDVLKDASSAAIYGSQASNGVILITSKSGKTQSKPVVEYSTNYSIQTPTNAFVPMQADEYEQFYPDIFWAEGGRLAPDFLTVDPNYVWQNNFKDNAIREGFNNGLDTPWWDLFTGSGFVNTHNLSVRGRTESIGYFVSGGITDQQAYLKNDEYTRYNFRINLDAKINDWLKIGTQTFVTVSDYSGASAPAQIPFILQPWTPIRDADGEPIPQPDGTTINPLLILDQPNSDVRKNFFSNIYADVKLPLNGLSYRLNYSNNYRTFKNSNFSSFARGFNGQASKSFSETRDWTLDNILTYQKTFNQDHNINLTLLYGVEKRNFDGFNATASFFDIDILGFDRLQAGDPAQNVVSSNKEQETSLYSMARLLYDYKNKYYFTGTVRRDGFSGFGRNNKTAVFPTIGLGWVVSNEDFLKDNSWLNFLKLRASYGQSGRRGIGRYDTAAIINIGPSYVFGDGGQSAQGQSISSLPNDNLTWETTTGTNIGLDFSILNSRINGNIEYYRNKTEDILFAIALPNITGFNSINSNIAEVSNKGLDITLSANLVSTDDWNWELSGNFSSFRNNIESILGPENDADGDGLEDDLIGNRLFIGEPQNVIYDYEITGMWQLADEANGDIPAGFFPGTYKLADLNGDGEFSSLDDRKIVGYQDPAYRFGIGNTVSYKNLSLFIFVNSIQGGKNHYYGNDAPHSVADFSRRDQLSFSNVPSGGWDYWLPENPNARYRRLDLGSQFGGTPYTQRSFVRLQDVSLSYAFPEKLKDAMKLSNLKLFVSGKNLATWTKWNGVDPETGIGFTYGSPLLKSYTLGLSVEF